MSFFKLRRTKMLDDAVFNHKPQSLLIALLIFYLVFTIGQFISNVIVSIPTVAWMLSYDGFLEMIKEYTEATMAGNDDSSALVAFVNQMISDQPSWIFLVSLFSSAALIATAIFYCRKFEKRPISSLGIRKKHIFREYGLGAVIGLVMIGLTFLISFLFDSVSIKLNPSGFNPMIILFLLAFIIQGASEEIMFRGYFMITIARDYKPAVAIGVVSILFSLLHSGNNEYGILPFINILLFGIFIGVYVFKRGDLWGACAIHSMWNFAQGCIIGSNVSGLSKIPSVFVLEAKDNMTLANGGSFGLEGSIATTIIMLVAIALVFLLKTKKGEESLSDATDFE